MKWLYNMKIAVKLVLGFVVVAAIGLAIGWVGIVQIRAVDQQNIIMYSELTLPSGDAIDLTGMYQRSRVVLRDIILANEPDVMNGEIESFQEKIQGINNAYSQLDTGLKDAKAREILTTVKKNLEAYLPQTDKVLALAKENKDVEAEALLQSKEVDDIAGALSSNIDALSKRIDEAAMERAGISKSTVDSAVLVMLLLAAAGFLVSIGLGLFISRVIGKPVRRLMKAADKLATGDVDVEINVQSKDELGVLADAFRNVIQSVHKLTSDATMLSEAAVAGRLSTRADATQHQGAYRKVVEGVNDTLDAVIRPLDVAAEQLAKMGSGAELQELDESQFSGDFKVIIQNMNLVRGALYGMLGDVQMLNEAALDGKLSTRADLSKHKGSYQQIVGGVNATLDALIKPIEESIRVLHQLSQGNLDVSVEGDFRGDYANIKNALNDTIRTLKAYIGEISLVLSEIAGGNLDVNIHNEYLGDFQAIKQSLNNIVDSLNIVMGDINTAAEQVANGTGQVSGGAQALSQGATEQASAIEQLTVSIATIAEQTKQNAMSASQASALSAEAKESAVVGNGRMQEMVRSMQDIDEASTSISKIIKVIDDIAFQTNLLALNAAVEAARAGQYGKGFAVVAEEVRSLAGRSANAAKETTTLIEGTIKKVEHGTRIANDTADALGGIVASVEKASNLVDGIAAASNEQATSVAQVSQGIEQVSQVVQTNSATAEESAATSEELSSQAELLREMVNRFHLKGGKAQHTVRSAQSAPALPHGVAQGIPGKPKINLENGFGKY